MIVSLCRARRVREARSSQNTIVRSGIQPQQTRNRWDNFNGKAIHVTSGPNEGLIGKWNGTYDLHIILSSSSYNKRKTAWYYTCTGTANICTLARNNYYFISPLFSMGTDIDVVVHARHLELISE